VPHHQEHLATAQQKHSPKAATPLHWGAPLPSAPVASNADDNGTVLLAAQFGCLDRRHYKDAGPGHVDQGPISNNIYIHVLHETKLPRPPAMPCCTWDFKFTSEPMFMPALPPQYRQRR
jgi:hypothetical protein